MFRKLYDDTGDFAVATLMAELWAKEHAMPNTETASGRAVSDRRAVCVAGDWARDVFDATPHTSGAGSSTAVGVATFTLSPGDLDEAVQVLLGAGDGRLRSGAGQPFERVDAFRVGFFKRAAAC